MDNIPIIRIEIEHMKASLLTAITEHNVQMDEYVRLAIDKFCDPDNLKKIVNAVVDRELEQAIAEEVVRFFRHGNGRQAIVEAVQKRLDISLPNDVTCTDTPPGQRGDCRSGQPY